ncbi:hypothetical protein F66182_5241 [Fusarium sp. NRRL 66182]|nr:hypothetical protein F66182_5241 [Fusarium sp. NRRL 66182]
MWEVAWADPKKESRREHRERKATKPAQSYKGTPKARSIFSRGSSSSSESTSFASFSRRKHKERHPVSLSPTTSSVSIRTSDVGYNYELETDRLSIFSTRSEQATLNLARVADLNSKRNGQILDTAQDIFINHNSHVESPFPLPSQLPTPPLNTEVTELVALAPCHVVQTLSEGSFIARSTEVTSTLRKSTDDPLELSCEVTIVANPSCKTPSRPRSSSHASLRNPRSRLLQSKHKELKRMASSGLPLSTDWKPPDDWKCSPTEASFPFADGPVTEAETQAPMEMNAMQREVKQLAGESNVVRLLRLAESQNVGSPPGSCNDLEVEKMQWMLSALYDMEHPLHLGSNHEPLESPSSEAKKVLALYETPGTKNVLSQYQVKLADARLAVTSYLAAVNHDKQLYHLSPAPLSHILFPNIRPIAVPVRSPSALPVAPSAFEAVYSLRLPLAMPSQDIPALLKSIHRCLEPGGSLQLTIIDPLPVASTLGPLLRSWIEDNLLLNLEANFRCTNPARLLPMWLNNASLRVDASYVKTTQFSAIPLDNSQLQFVQDGRLSAEDVKQELRNLVGRMLWMEVWREYIIADYWWWEDQQILQECMELQTTWEWRLIEAVKDA